LQVETFTLDTCIKFWTNIWNKSHKEQQQKWNSSSFTNIAAKSSNFIQSIKGITIE